ncbi:uncharacterized protein LOC122508383 [Leptopilina heterotoma]|uniref:uncharacterized protein LOC122508383 n=1 Tax=Leptopilina heterotoma TaxID=63436 RepID=UPI001CA808F6|nr:uncharacterized protein LOC122508383 [Leptopilina heterotoma]
MFKFVALLCLAAVVVAKPGAIFSPIISDIVSEKVIESHGNSVVHAAAPYAVHGVAGVSLLGEKTIEAHGNSIVHSAAPVLHSVPLTYSYGLAYNQPIYLH